MNRKILKVKYLTKLYGKVKALDDVSFELEEKGFVFVNGISGSGKTTLMNMLSGMDSSTTGEIYYNDRNIAEFSDNELDNYRNSEIGIVFQNFNLIDDITVEENLLLPLMIQDISDMEKRKLVKDVLSYVGLSDFDKRKGYELSAGQKQRVAIARAIIKKPKIIFADEATGNLDEKNTQQILKLFNDISKKCLVVLISHNNISAKKFADRIITLDEGKISKDIDNKELKDLYLEPYKISISGHNVNKDMSLEEFDIKVEIKDLVEKMGCKLDSYSFNTKITLDEKKEAVDETWVNEKNVTIRHMPFSEILKCISRIMIKQKLKNIFVICLFAFISTLFFLTNVLVRNDYYMSISRYINDSDCSIYVVKKSNISDSESQNYSVYKGKGIVINLKDFVGENNVISSLDDVIISKNADIYSVNAFIYSNFFDSLELTGNWPIKQNDIVVSKQFATDANICLGDYVSDDTREYNVVGICDFSNLMKEYSVVISKDYNNNIFEENQCINLQSCNVLKSLDFDEYVNEIVTIGSSANINVDTLIWGRMPQKSNEIIVSDYMLQENEMNLNKDFITKYRIPNLQEEKYNNKYDSFVNVYDYLGKNVEIVGVYKSEDNDIYGDILVEDSLYNEIIYDYKEYLNFDSCYVYLGNDNYDVIKKMLQEDFYLCDDICTYIYSIQNFFHEIESVMKILSVVILLMVIFVIISFLSYNVKGFSKTIGIYKSLGIKNIDIAKIFILDNLIICIISIIIANIALHGIIYCINNKIFSILNESRFDVFVINEFGCIAMSMVIAIISIVATVVPLKRMLDKESVTLINKEGC